jgi:hypothetical protein
MASYIAKINEEVPLVPKDLTQEEDQRKIDDIWSNMSMTYHYRHSIMVRILNFGLLE